MFDLYKEIETMEKEILDIAEEYTQKECDEIADLGNPEELVHKPYARWTPQDFQVLNNIYVYDRGPLEKFIKSKEIDKLFESIKQNEV